MISNYAGYYIRTRLAPYFVCRDRGIAVCRRLAAYPVRMSSIVYFYVPVSTDRANEDKDPRFLFNFVASVVTYAAYLSDRPIDYLSVDDW